MPEPDPLNRVRQDLLMSRYEGHWYPEEPHRGCAFRALLSTVNQLDPLLLRAAESTGQRGLFESFNRVFADAGEVNCWVRATPPKKTRRTGAPVLSPRPVVIVCRCRTPPLTCW
jgi:hypothetical protein